MSISSYSFHSLSLKLPNKGMSFLFPSLKLPNKGREEYSKIILFIPFHSIHSSQKKKKKEVFYVYISRMLISYRTGRYGRYIPYQPVHRYKYTHCFVPEKIPVVPASYRAYRRNPAVSAGKNVSDRYKQEEKRKRKGRRRWEKVRKGEKEVEQVKAKAVREK